MALISPQSIVRAGLQASFAAPNASDTFIAGPNIFYYAKVGSTATTFTFTVGKIPVVGVTYANLVVGPITSNDELIGPFPSSVFGDPATGLVTVTTSNQTNVTVAVFALTS
jgi:hypothetical protein